LKKTARRRPPRNGRRVVHDPYQSGSPESIARLRRLQPPTLTKPAKRSSPCWSADAVGLFRRQASGTPRLYKVSVSGGETPTHPPHSGFSSRPNPIGSPDANGSSSPPEWRFEIFVSPHMGRPGDHDVNDGLRSLLGSEFSTVVYGPAVHGWTAASLSVL